MIEGDRVTLSYDKVKVIVAWGAVKGHGSPVYVLHVFLLGDGDELDKSGKRVLILLVLHVFQLKPIQDVAPRLLDETHPGVIHAELVTISRHQPREGMTNINLH